MILIIIIKHRMGAYIPDKPVIFKKKKDAFTYKHQGGIKMKLHLFADIHLYAPKALNKLTVNRIIDYDKNITDENNKVLLLGDIIDVKNTRKKHIRHAVADVLRLIEHFGGRYVLGNHELNISKGLCYNQSFIFNNQNIKISHGHRFFWSIEKANDWETREPKGISNCKYRKMQAVQWMDEKFYRGKKIKPTKKLLTKFDNSAIADVFIMGHKHPKETFDHVYNNKRLIILKRGLSAVTV